MRPSNTCALVVAALLVAAVPASSQYILEHHVIGSGGGTVADAEHVLAGTVGQAAIGVADNASNVIQAGFWYMPSWILTGIDDGELVPLTFQLGQNHPNPFNPITTIRFTVPERTRVAFVVYDVTGRSLKTLIDDVIDPGYHRAVLDATGLASGVYFYRMVSGDFIETRKVVLLK